MEIKEIKAEDLNPEEFIAQKTEEIQVAVGDGKAIVAFLGNIDSLVITVLAYRALGERLNVYFVDNGLMRKNEAEEVVFLFKQLEIPVHLFDAKKQFLKALKKKRSPESKRKAILQVFYKDVFGWLAKNNDIGCLLQGTTLSDIEETVGAAEGEYNIFEQLDINQEETLGYKIVAPLVQLRKDGVRKIANALGLPESIPESIYKRISFPGLALAARIIGEVTPEKLKIAREATEIVENELEDSGAFQYMAILHHDKVRGIRDGKRAFGFQVEIRCWDSVNARTAEPTRLDYDVLERLVRRITEEIPGIVSVTYNISPKPPSTMEAL